MALACACHVRRLLLLHPGAGAPARSFYAQPYQAKVGVVEFLNGVGKGVETHAAKLEEAVGGDLQRLLETRTLRLKKLGVPCKHRQSTKDEQLPLADPMAAASAPSCTRSFGLLPGSMDD
ncbi:uncharacterized protein [Aegilops tauschii subsp. strangulata]|uniref:uncharacterized protein isoform X1 n=1 Tax=Aegilops tauschii subsp. strangulata TaxID=200361 RepID=UPI00098A0E71|nr:uncharacterized protein LOC109741924 isoform X1 [Aegilops tauschii subsp. strangulata]